MVSAVKTWICHPAHAYGREKRHYTDLHDLDAKLQEFDMPNFPEMWGWGNYYISDAPRYELADTVVSECIGKLAAGCTIDHVIFSSSEISETFMASNDRLKYLLARHNLLDIPVSGVSLTGCNNLLTALIMGRGLLISGLATNVLVVTEEKVRSESFRFDRHCIFSDGACAFLLSSGIRSELEIIDVDTRFCPASEENVKGIFRGNLGRINEGYKSLLSRHGVAESQLATVIAPNYFPPLLQVLFGSVGIPNGKRFSENETISMNGHCYACDYLINLQKYISTSHANEEYILLFAYADMHYGLCLIKRGSGA